MTYLIKNLLQYNLWRQKKLIIYLKNNPIEIVSKKDDGLFFGTIKNTFNHMNLADYLWLMRCYNIDNIKCEISNTNITLKNIEKFWKEKNIENDLSIFFNENDYEWRDNFLKRFENIYFTQEYSFINFIDKEIWEKEVEYFTTEGNKAKIMKEKLFIHLINHYTHHIGQITNSFHKFYGKNKLPELDYSYFED